MRDPVTIGLRCQDAGVQAIALHPRTRTQMYSGAARWEEIAKLVDALDIPAQSIEFRLVGPIASDRSLHDAPPAL